jgi:glycosyltransferase involved in cell wall biosynthesis
MTMIENNPLITVITVVYNAVDTIEETLISVIHQTYTNIEYIVVDGASVDGTVDIIKKYENHLTCWKSEPDKGIFDAMNKGIAMATGEWINFMNSGDKFCNNDITQKIFQNQNNDNFGVIWGTVLIRTNKDVTEEKYIPFYKNPRKFRGMGICHQSIFVKTFLAKENPFNIKYKTIADYNMIKTIYDNNVGFKELDFPVCEFEGTGGFSQQNVMNQFYEIASLCGIKKSSPQFILRWIKRVILKFLQLLKKLHCFFSYRQKSEIIRLKN